MEETIFRFREALAWNFSETGRFEQTIEVESGSSNTYTETAASLQSRLMGALSWKLS